MVAAVTNKPPFSNDYKAWKIQMEAYTKLVSQGEASMSAVAEAPVGLSLKPEDAVVSGFLDNTDVRILSARVKMWDYNGSIPAPIVALEVQFQKLDDGSTPKPQYYSAGDPKNFVPSADFRKFVPINPDPTKRGLPEGCNALLFLASLINAGFPANKVTDDVAVFDGTDIHVVSVPQPKRDGLAPQVKADGTVKKNNIVIAQKVLRLPWEAGQSLPTPGNAAGVQGQGPVPMASVGGQLGQVMAPNPGMAMQAPQVAASSPQTPAGVDLAAKAAEGMLAILSGKGGSISKAALAQEAFKYFAKDPDRNALVQLVFKDEFLKTPGMPWSFDGTTVSFGG